jgi:hypothetical protein
MTQERGPTGEEVVRRGSNVRCGGYKIRMSLCVLGCSSVFVGEGGCVRDCRVVGRMGECVGMAQ